jgi:hypothetical protein
MDFDGAIKTFETYAVDFVRYILSLFSRQAFRRRAPDLEKKLFTFALISALLGAFLNMKYVSGLTVGENDLVTPVVTEFSIWIAFSVLVWIGVGLGRPGATPYTPALTAVLRVLPVTYVIGAYVGFLLTNLAQLWTSPGCAPWQAYAGILVVRFVLLVAYMPLSICLVASHLSPGRTRIVGLAVAGAMLAVQAGTLGAFLVSQADKACAHANACANPGAVHGYVIQELQSLGRCL